jgi:hypothetical protein
MGRGFLFALLVAGAMFGACGQSASDASCPAGQKPCDMGGKPQCVPIDPQHGCNAVNVCLPCDDMFCPGAKTMCDPWSGGCLTLACDLGYADCNHDCHGCETAIWVDVQNCGTCGRVCDAVPNAEPSCVRGACVANCNPGFGDCDQNYRNGCEVDLTQDASHCGMCATACEGGASCQGGNCL